MQIGLLGMKISGPRGPSLKGPSSEIGDPGGPLGQQVEEYAFRGIRQGKHIEERVRGSQGILKESFLGPVDTEAALEAFVIAGPFKRV